MGPTLVKWVEDVRAAFAPGAEDLPGAVWDAQGDVEAALVEESDVSLGGVARSQWPLGEAHAGRSRTHSKSRTEGAMGPVYVTTMRPPQQGSEAKIYFKHLPLL